MSRVLFVDDEVFSTSEYVHGLQERGIEVTIARSLAEAKKAVAAEASILDLVITDIMMPGGDGEDPVATHGGFRSGLRLAQWLKDNYRDIPVLALTFVTDLDVEDWFQKNGAGIINKPVLYDEFADTVADILGRRSRAPRVFIVHGHDDATKYSLKNYLQNTLRLPEPVVLHEQPNEGRTILEKFEFHATRADVVFVLLTPDDLGSLATQRSCPLPRARQNVVFELGYFLGRLGRKKGRVIVLHRGPVELPSDVIGLVYIDISDGIESAGERIRRELFTLWPNAK